VKEEKQTDYKTPFALLTTLAVGTFLFSHKLKFPKQDFLLQFFEVKKQNTLSPVIQNVKVCFLDIDNTLTRYATRSGIKKSFYEAVIESFGEEGQLLAKDEYHKFIQGEQSYEEWLNNFMHGFKKLGLNKSRFEKILRQVKIIEGVPELLGILKENNIKIVLLTAGFAEQGWEFNRYGVSKVISSSRCRWSPDEELLFWSVGNLEGKGKAHAALEHLSSLGWTKDQAMFIGDGKNDVEIASFVKYSFAVHDAPKELKEVSTWVVPGLREALQIIQVSK